MDKKYMYVSSNPIENLFHNILYYTEDFEMRTGFKPTIFITPDLFNALARNYRRELAYTTTKDEPDMLCGYVVEQIRSDKSGVFIGYKILEEEKSDEVCEIQQSIFSEKPAMQKETWSGGGFGI